MKAGSVPAINHSNSYIKNADGNVGIFYVR